LALVVGTGAGALPYTIRRKVPNAGVISSIFREVRHNIPIDESKFKVPNP
jgi:hypothetical protein